MPLHETAASRLLRTLPLDALRGFEAAARRLSFTEAAEELSLTQSAVSKQVKALEDAVGVALFVRGGRGLALTAEGRALHDGTQRLLGELQRTLAQVLPSGRAQVSLSVPPSFASMWLAPRLAQFQARHPGIDLHVDASEDALLLEREGVDLAVRQALPGQAPPDWTLLARERVLLVAAPTRAAQVQRPADLLAQPLLVFHHPVERFDWMSWPHWFQALGLGDVPSQAVFRFSQYEHVVAAALQGTGVAIGRVPLVLPQLRAGTLQGVLPEVQGDGLAHHLVRHAREVARPEVQSVAGWIEAAMAADAAG
jgi:DNA-binding transcriptional LysR family regulator